MRHTGSSDHARAVAAAALLAAGATNLEAKLGAHVASFGEVCWQTDATVREVIRRSDGRRYHRESIGRARRHLDRIGFMRSRRIFTGQKPAENAKFRSTHGTTAKSIVWSALRIQRPPMPRGERRRRARAQEIAPVGTVIVGPRHSALGVSPPVADRSRSAELEPASPEEVRGFLEEALAALDDPPPPRRRPKPPP